MQTGVSIKVTKIQKLMYICQGLYYKIYDEQLINETPKALPYGPIFVNSLEVMQNNPDNWWIEDKMGSIAKLDIILNLSIMKSFFNMSVNDIILWSHQKGSPWYEVLEKSTKYGAEISNEMIKNYFKQYEI
jgi:uncharacterized phage-associated protein